MCLIASTPPALQIKNSANQKLQKIAKKVNNIGWVYFKDNFKPDPQKFFSNYKDEFNLSKYDEMKFVKEESDSISKFYKFKRYYKGILVEGSGYTLKYKNDNLELAIGHFIDDLIIDITDVISPEIALKEALKSTNASKFAWEDENYESMIKREKRDNTATWLPKGELVITKTNKGEYRLAYSFDILSVQPEFDHSIQYIDAKNGSYIKEKSLIFDATGAGITYHNGEKSITTYYNNNLYYLEEDTRGIIRAKLNEWRDWNGYPDWYDENYPILTDEDNYWDELIERPAVSGLWAVQKAFDYFHNTFYRHGLENITNKEIQISTKYPRPQAKFNPVVSGATGYDEIALGYYNNVSYSSLDIVGHEYMHGVTYYRSGLAMVAEESGAINESFSDFFGECIEYYVNNTCDWLVGTDVDTVRSMISPIDSPYFQPDHYQGEYWYYSDPNINSDVNISHYVHTNSGVLNKWFYLLAHGDSQQGVNGIGISWTANIAYATLYWLDEDADFWDVYWTTLFLALESEGGDICGTRYEEVQNAWAAVGMGDPAPDPCPLTIGEFHISDNPPPECGGSTMIYIDVTGGSGNYTYEWWVNSEFITTNQYLWILLVGGIHGQLLY